MRGATGPMEAKGPAEGSKVQYSNMSGQLGGEAEEVDELSRFLFLQKVRNTNTKGTNTRGHTHH